MDFGVHAAHPQPRRTARLCHTSGRHHSIKYDGWRIRQPPYLIEWWRLCHTSGRHHSIKYDGWRIRGWRRDRKPPIRTEVWRWLFAGLAFATRSKKKDEAEAKLVRTSSDCAVGNSFSHA